MSKLHRGSCRGSTCAIGRLATIFATPGRSSQFGEIANQRTEQHFSQAHLIADCEAYCCIKVTVGSCCGVRSRNEFIHFADRIVSTDRFDAIVECHDGTCANRERFCSCVGHHVVAI
jgi:hypothetical protein